VLAVALLLLGYVAYSTYVPQADRILPADDETSPQVRPNEPTATVPAVPPSEQGAEPQALPQQNTGPLERPPSPAPQPAERATPEAVPEPQQSPVAAAPDTAASSELVIVVDGESWLEIQDATGASRYSSLVQGPRTLAIEGTPPFNLLIGNAPAVEVRYAGEIVALRPHTRGRVARLTVPATP
jgi:cytoskeleton protein RodZ